jgi:hypothetical protein
MVGFSNVTPTTYIPLSKHSGKLFQYGFKLQPELEILHFLGREAVCNFEIEFPQNSLLRLRL